MPKQTNQPPPSQKATFWRVMDNVKRAWRIFRDPSVSPMIRYGIPMLGLLYLISPIDIIPDVLLGLGQLDDAAILILLSQLMIMLAPNDAVQRYQHPTSASTERPDVSAEDGDVIDADYRVIT